MQIPLGYCECGCGEKTTISAKNDARHGYVKGRPRRFVKGHGNGRQMPTVWSIEDRGYETPCWIWQGGVSGKYGWWGSRRMSAHRACWIDEHGSIPRGYTLHHRCEQTMCVRPNHLRLLTKSEHRRIHPYAHRRRYKLTAKQAEEIAASTDSLGLLAQRFGITRQHAAKLRRLKGRTTGDRVVPTRAPTQHRPRRRGRRKGISAADYLVEDRGYETPCWIWRGRNPASAQYGKARGPDGRARPAHIVFYEQEIGPLPSGMHLDHLCGVPRCIRPDHLEPVSNAENIRRGRSAKLTWEIVREIRASSEPHVVLAKRYDVHPESIRFVRIGRTWKE